VGSSPGSLQVFQLALFESYMAIFPAFHSLIHRRPLEYDQTRRVPAWGVGGSTTVVAPLSRSTLPRKLPGPARRLLEVKALGAGSNADDAEYTVRISRVRDGAMVTFDATEETMLSPGDAVEVKLKRRAWDSTPSLSTQAIRKLDPISSVAEGSQPASR
jgi:hypothetical protein